MEQMVEHRRSSRRRTIKGGTILFGTTSAIDCVIRNLSETGAALEVESQAGIPDSFTLLIKPERIKRDCQVAWRSGKRIGVRFGKGGAGPFDPLRTQVVPFEFASGPLLPEVISAT
jgi:hypothetical protein